MNNFWTYITIFILIVALMLLIAAVIYIGVTNNINAVFWGLIITGIVLTFIGVMVLIIRLLWEGSNHSMYACNSPEYVINEVQQQSCHIPQQAVLVQQCPQKKVIIQQPNPIPQETMTLREAQPTSIPQERITLVEASRSPQKTVSFRAPQKIPSFQPTSENQSIRLETMPDKTVTSNQVPMVLSSPL